MLTHERDITICTYLYNQDYDSYYVCGYNYDMYSMFMIAIVYCDCTDLIMIMTHDYDHY